MVSDDDAVRPARDCCVGGASAFRYLLVVLRWIPNSRSIARSDIPLRRAFGIAFHLSPWRKVGLRAEVALGLLALATPSGIIPSPFSSVALESGGSRVAVQVSRGNHICRFGVYHFCRFTSAVSRRRQAN